MGTLDGTVALVTGGSRGIGRGIAERLGSDGAVVVVTYARERAAAEEVVERIHKDGGQAFAIQAEFGRHGDAHAMWDAFDAVVERPGVDIIVNNAAIGTSGDLESMSEDEFDRLFAVNVRAPFFLVQQGLGRLRDRGRIINISSGAASIALPDIMAYGATKGALDTLTLNLAKQLGSRGITVNSVAPGIVDTDTNAPWLRGNAEALAHAESLSALGRIGQPEDIAGVVSFLASDDASWMTGRVVDVTGGAGL